MNPPMLSFEADIQPAQLAPARVQEVREPWVYVVVDGPAGGIRRCLLLQTVEGGALHLAAGDPVLVWTAPGQEESGVILGRVGPARAPREKSESPTEASAGTPSGLPAPADELVIEARENLTLKCGEGSITLRADGKILIKGKDLVSHAQRMNRIKGGAVAIN